MTGVKHTEWPSKGEITPLQQKIQTSLKEKKHELPSLAVTSCDVKSRSEDTIDIFVFHQWDRTSPFGLFGVTESQVDQLAQFLQEMEQAGEVVEDNPSEKFIIPQSHPFHIEPLKHKHFIMTCAHVKRDMRCGYCGSLLHDLIEKHVEQHKLQDEIFTARVNHIGGHAYAGNVLLYPEGIWYGYMKPNDVPRIFEEHIQNGKILKEKLRGKLGLTKEEAVQLANHE